MNPPGCPKRRVTRAEAPDNPKLRGHGVVLTLSCGHQQWVAGMDPTQPELADVRKLNVIMPCFGGCYVPQRPMGDQCH